jgi:hypothetical protein
MKITRIALHLALFSGLVFAQQNLTNDSVLKLVKAGMGDDLIVNMINTQACSFSVSTDDLIALKTAGVSPKVIAAMLLKTPTALPRPLPPPARSTK